MNGLFDAYVIIDWSAASVPKTGADSIWVAVVGRRDGALDLINPPTRAAAGAWVADRLTGLLDEGRRVLVGVDFPLGYPEGTARRLGLTGTPWRATWDLLAAQLEDEADNRNNRFAVAASLNRRMTEGPVPFWGCPPAASSPFLLTRKPAESPLADWRAAERRVRGVQSVWKLYTTGSVGSQALTGIPHVRAWCRNPHAQVWPFETGFAPPTLPLVFAEVWPSLLKDAWKALHPVKDAGQVLALARHFARLDEDGRLRSLFTGPDDLTAAEHAAAVSEEGWILP